MAILAKRGVVRLSPFAYPGTKPGFNPSHFGASGISAGLGFSGIAAGGTVFSLLDGSKGAVTGAVTNPVNGTIATYASVPANGHIDFSGQSTANNTLATIAAIVFPPATGTAQAFFSSGVWGTNGFGLGTSAGTNLRARYGTGTYSSSSLTFAATTPYFVAVSMNGSVANFIIRNLLTGVLVTETVAGANSAVATGGTYIIGASGPQTAAVNVASVLFAPNYLHPAQLVQFSADPWAFWYPR